MRLINKYKNAIILLVMLCVSVRGLAQYTLQAVYPVKGPGCNGGFEFKTGGSAFPLDIYIIQSLRDLLQNSFEDESELAKLPFSGKLFQDLKRASDDFLQYVLSHTGQFHSYDLLKAFPSLRTDVKLLEALDAAIVGKSPAEIADLVKILNGKTEKEARKIIETLTIIGNIFKNLTFADFAATFTATLDDQKLLYKLWGESKYDELFQMVVSKNINSGRPPFYGFSNSWISKFGQELEELVFDRFQNPGRFDLEGSFASPVYNLEGISDLHFTYDSRAIGTNIPDGTIYIKFRMKGIIDNNVRFDFGEVMPWEGSHGLGDQIKSNTKLNDLFDKGNIEILEKLTYKKLTNEWIPQ